MYMYCRVQSQMKAVRPHSFIHYYKKIKDLKNQQKITTNEKLLKRYQDLGVHMDKYYFS